MGALVSDAERTVSRRSGDGLGISDVRRLVAQTGLLNAGAATVRLLGGIIASGRVYDLADRWYRALTVTLAAVGMGG